MFKRAHTSYRKAYIITALLCIAFVVGFIALSGKLPKSKPLQQFEIEAIEQVRVGKLPGDVNAVQKKQPPVARVGVPPAGGGSRRRVPPASNLKAANGKGAGDETDEAREAAEAPPDANAKPHRADAAAGPKVRRGTAKRLGLAADETAGAKEHAAEEHADDEEHAAHVDANLRARLKNAAAQKD